MIGKKGQRAKASILVDTNGFLLRVLVHAAMEGAKWLLSEHYHHFPRLEEFGSIKDRKRGLSDGSRSIHPYSSRSLKIRRNTRDVRFSEALVGGTLDARAGRDKLTSHEYNRNPESSEAFIYLGSVTMFLNRLYPGKQFPFML